MLDERRYLLIPSSNYAMQPPFQVFVREIEVKISVGIHSSNDNDMKLLKQMDIFNNWFPGKQISLQQATQNKFDFSGLEPHNRSLRMAGLIESSFKETKPDNVTFQQAILLDTNFKKAEIGDKVDFFGAICNDNCTRPENYKCNGIIFRKIEMKRESINLNEIDLEGYNLSGSNLKNATLRKTVFKNVILKDTDLKGAYLEDVILERALYDNETKCSEDFDPTTKKMIGPKCDLQNEDLSGKDLAGMNQQGVHLQEINLKGANLQGVNLSKADLRNVDLADADPSKSNLSGTNFEGTTLEGVKHKKCRIDFTPEGF